MNLPKEFAAYLTSQGLNRGSVRNYTADLGKFTRWYKKSYGKDFTPTQISLSLLQSYEKDLTEEGVPDSTRRRNLATLKQFIRWVRPDDFTSFFNPYSANHQQSISSYLPFKSGGQNSLSKKFENYSAYLTSQG